MRKYWLNFISLFQPKRTRVVWLEYFIGGGSRGKDHIIRINASLRIIKVTVKTRKCNEGLFYELRKKDVAGSKLNGVYSRRTATELLDGFEKSEIKEEFDGYFKRTVKKFGFGLD